MNKLIALGNLGHLASVRTVDTARGSQPVVNFSLAVKIGYGEHERTQWYDCHWWGERAERASEWLTKGKKVLIEGEPELQTYEKRTGGTGAKIAVRVLSVDFADAAKRPAAQAMETAAAAPAQSAAPAASKAAENLDEDVPF